MGSTRVGNRVRMEACGTRRAGTTTLLVGLSRLSSAAMMFALLSCVSCAKRPPADEPALLGAHAVVASAPSASSAASGEGAPHDAPSDSEGDVSASWSIEAADAGALLIRYK